MIKKLLYIGCPYMGENLFGTPCMEIFSKEYEITLITPKWSIPVFKDYSFIKNILPSEGNRNTSLVNVRFPESTIQSIKEIFCDPQNSFYVSQNDWDINVFKRYDIKGITPLPMREDKSLDMNMTRTRRYLHKMMLMTPEESSNYDCSIRIPSYEIPKIKNNNIIVCQGSGDYLRKLPNETIKYFLDILPNAVFLVEQSTAKLLDFDRNNINYIITSPSDDLNLLKIIDLYKSGPRAIIGPDTGLIQLALSYKIPCVWLESRTRVDGVTDYQYKNLIKIHRKKEVFCKQDCQARMFYKQVGEEVFEYLPKLKNIDTESRFLYCRKYAAPSCLDYSKEEVKEIISLIN